MSAPSPPPDMSLQVEQQREQAQRDAQAAADQKAAQHASDLAALRSQSRAGATGQVGNYFTSQGVDPTKYAGSIESQLNTILSGISPTEENPGAAFTGAGQSIWDTLQTGERTKYGNELNTLFPSNFQATRVPTTIDDPYIASIGAEQYSNADAIIKNMLDRGVLTSGGYASAQKDLENQKAGVTARLNEIGGGLIGKEQSDLGTIANTARQAAGQAQLGSTFDPYSYGSQADQSFNEFLTNLGTNIRAQVPGALFNTAGLAAIGGAGQGAGNTAFNPAAAAGITDDTTQDPNAPAKPVNPNSIF